MHRAAIALFFLSLTPPPSALLAQRKVDPAFQGERILAIVPMVGTGTAQDPRRPLFAPLPGERTTISGFMYQISDDGRSALVQFVARSRSDFQTLLSAARADVKVFERGKATLEQVETEFRKVKPGFDVRQFVGGVR